MKSKIHKYQNKYYRMGKNFKSILVTIVLVAAVTMVSCKDNKAETKTETTTAIEKQGKEHTSAYVCPMHCKGSGSDKEGKCGTCGMGYVKNEDNKKDDSHEGHNHE